MKVTFLTFGIHHLKWILKLTLKIRLKTNSILLFPRMKKRFMEKGFLFFTGIITFKIGNYLYQFPFDAGVFKLWFPEPQRRLGHLSFNLKTPYSSNITPKMWFPDGSRS